MIKIENITFGYPKRPVPIYEHFSLDIAAGGVYGLLGPNGAGKSTLLYIIAGLLNCAEGRVTYRGINTRLRLPSVMSDIFLIPEEFTLPAISIRRYAEVTSPMYPHFSFDDMYANLNRFGIDCDTPMGTMSMGQRKKAFIAFALACNTSLLLMDEPTNGLDIPGKAQFRSVIASAMNDERTIIISTHQVRDIDRMLDHIIIIDEKGHIRLDASTYDITSQWTFGTTSDPSVVKEAVYVRPSIGGFSVILPLKDDEDASSDVDIEMLFEYVMSSDSPIILSKNTIA